MSLLARIPSRNTVRRVVNFVPTARFSGSFIVRRSVSPTSFTPEQLRRIREDIEYLKEQDQIRLGVVAQKYSSIIKWLQANRTETPTWETTLETAGPQDYVCVEEIKTLRISDFGMSDYIAELEMLRTHVHDLQTEPYAEWDLITKPAALSEAEMTKLDLELSVVREALGRDMAIHGKHAAVLESVVPLVEQGKYDAAKKALKDGARKIHNESAGVIDISDSSPWKHGKSKRPRKRKEKTTEKDTGNVEEAEDEQEESFESEDDWTDHSRFIDDDYDP